MMFKLIVAFALFSNAPLHAADSPLVGAWEKDDSPFAELKADGTGRVDQDVVTWKTYGKLLTLLYTNGQVQMLPYTLKGATLTVVMDGKTVVYTRSKEKKSRAKAGAAAPAKDGTGGDPLSALLLSSPWCYFHFSQISGATHEERVVFRRDGRWGSGARAETYFKGDYGSVAGQSDSGSGGLWQARGGRLLMSQGRGALEDVGLTLSRNSNGYPILKAAEKEYSQCK